MASPVTIQPSTADTHIYENDATTNFGTNVIILIYHGAGLHRFGLCKFDFHTSVPAGATITVATLSLYNTDAKTRTIGVYRLLRTDWSESQSTWNIYKTGSNWGTAGALNTTTDYTTTDAATLYKVNGWNQWWVWDVKNQIQTALDSVSGIAHFLIKDTGADGAYEQDFGSNNAVDTTKRPILYIEYTVPSAVSPNFIPFFWA